MPSGAAGSDEDACVTRLSKTRLGALVTRCGLCGGRLGNPASASPRILVCDRCLGSYLDWVARYHRSGGLNDGPDGVRR